MQGWRAPMKDATSVPLAYAREDPVTILYPGLIRSTNQAPFWPAIREKTRISERSTAPMAVLPQRWGPGLNKLFVVHTAQCRCKGSSYQKEN